MNAERETAAEAEFLPAVPLSSLRESPLNPRKRFDPFGLLELEASIREKGVLTPLLVRRNGKKDEFEIAAGHRRFRAAKAAGLETVPALVRSMTDAELLEVLVIENDQREDVHPLEEADGYERILALPGYDVARIAAKVGRSAKYIYDRLKLRQLVPRAQAIFLEGGMTAGHAILLARLGAPDQERALGNADDMDGFTGGLFRRDGGQLLPYPDEDDVGVEEDETPVLKPASVREFETWINENVKFDRAAVDPMLFPETARALEEAASLQRRVVPITHEWRAPDAVRSDKERIYGSASWKRADGRAKGSKPCEHARLGVVVCGPGRGDSFDVCIDKEKCATHWKAWQKERVERAQGSADGGAASTSQAARLEREDRQRRLEQRRRDMESIRWKKAAPAILKAVAERVKKAPAKASGALASLVLEACGDNYRNVSARVAPLVGRGSSAEDVLRHAAMMVLFKQAELYSAPQDFQKLARGLGLEIRPILDKEAPPERMCRRCGCTEQNACKTPSGPCAWASADVCTGCATVKELAGAGEAKTRTAPKRRAGARSS